MPSEDQIDTYETTRPLLDSLYEEVRGLCKKKPDATLSASKVKLINRLLKDVRTVLKDEPEFKYLDLLDDESLPQNSDVVLILSQYTAAMDTFHSNYHGWDDERKTHRWFPDE